MGAVQSESSYIRSDTYKICSLATQTIRQQQQPPTPSLKMSSTADDETSGNGETPLAGGHPHSIWRTRRHNGFQLILETQPSSQESFYKNLNASHESLSQHIKNV